VPPQETGTISGTLHCDKAIKNDSGEKSEKWKSHGDGRGRDAEPMNLSREADVQKSVVRLDQRGAGNGAVNTYKTKKKNAVKKRKWLWSLSRGCRPGLQEKGLMEGGPQQRKVFTKKLARRWEPETLMHTGKKKQQIKRETGPFA